MKHWAGIGVAVGSFVAVTLLVTWLGAERVSPGALHPSHAKVPELAGSSGCAQCHGQSGESLDQACSHCHVAIADQLRDGIGLHGNIENGTDCAVCHIEHVDADVDLVGAHSFARAGVPDRERYGHDHVTAFVLTDVHDGLACARCHEHADASQLPPQSSRFLGLTQACASCHEDPHRGGFGTGCASCHGQSRPFADVALFDHAVWYPLDGAHRTRTCADCHDAAALQRGVDRAPPARVRGCSDCHDDPHRADADLPALRIDGSADCASCHSTSSFVPSTFSRTDHPRVAGFPLEGRHAEPSCVDCHGTTRGKPRWHDATSVEIQDCAACHADPHRAEFLGTVGQRLATPPSSTCVECHAVDSRSFLLPNATLPIGLHTASGFALDPPHVEIACTACHDGIGRSGQPYDRRFSSRDRRDCAACHSDPHGGQFHDRLSNTCVDCHADTHFQPTTFGVEAHDRAAFPLTGSHRAVGCALCHALESGVRRFVGTSQVCADCHDDPHRGAFIEAGAPVSCARCHSTETFAKTPWGATDHALWTSFALRGRHAKADCSSCHGQPFAPAPNSCASCHEDVHVGQFAIDRKSDCARCHVDSATFSDLRFDHDRDARFALDATHESLPCAACHRPTSTRGGASVIRYRPLGRECADCHRAKRRR